MTRALLLLTVLVGLTGCRTVKFVNRNTFGEVWTVYSNTLGSDSITYCGPSGGCREAVFSSERMPAEAAAPTPTESSGQPVPSPQPQPSGP